MLALLAASCRGCPPPEQACPTLQPRPRLQVRHLSILCQLSSGCGFEQRLPSWQHLASASSQTRRLVPRLCDRPAVQVPLSCS